SRRRHTRLQGDWSSDVCSSDLGGGSSAEASELIERLRARLGPEAVYGLRVLPAHRPENAWAGTEPAGAGERVARPKSCHAPWPEIGRARVGREGRARGWGGRWR